MATKYRPHSEADIYHVTTRGVAQQILFEDDSDRQAFGKRMRLYLDEEGIELFAWCFMSNHVHFLLHADLNTVREFMHKLLTSYASYFNKRYQRVGHLFQRRFDSVSVETDEQLLVAVRYIHRNPSEIPGVSYETYEWSSYREYTGSPFISKTDFVMQLFSGLDEFRAFHEAWEAECEESETQPFTLGLTDEQAVEYAKELLCIDSVSAIASMDKLNRDRCLATLREHGMPILQIARITGIGRNVVQRAHKRLQSIDSALGLPRK